MDLETIRGTGWSLTRRHDAIHEGMDVVTLTVDVTGSIAFELSAAQLEQLEVAVSALPSYSNASAREMLSSAREMLALLDDVLVGRLRPPAGGALLDDATCLFPSQPPHATPPSSDGQASQGSIPRFEPVFAPGSAR